MRGRRNECGRTFSMTRAQRYIDHASSTGVCACRKSVEDCDREKGALGEGKERRQAETHLLEVADGTLVRFGRDSELSELIRTVAVLEIVTELDEEDASLRSSKGQR